MRSEWRGETDPIPSECFGGDDGCGEKNERFISGDLGMLNGGVLILEMGVLLLGHLHKQPAAGPHTQTQIRFIIILVLETHRSTQCIQCPQGVLGEELQARLVTRAEINHRRKEKARKLMKVRMNFGFVALSESVSTANTGA